MVDNQEIYYYCCHPSVAPVNWRLYEFSPFTIGIERGIAKVGYSASKARFREQIDAK
jgi:hypothetical protein